MPKNKPLSLHVHLSRQCTTEKTAETSNSTSCRAPSPSFFQTELTKDTGKNLSSLDKKASEFSALSMQSFSFSSFAEMGCRESKHAVATGNTVTLKKSDAGSSRKIKDIKTVNETTQKEESQNVNKCSGDVAEVKDITDEDKELKEEDGFGFEGQELGRLISKESPNRFFSSRKHFSPSLVPEKESLFSDIIESNNEETQNGL